MSTTPTSSKQRRGVRIVSKTKVRFPRSSSELISMLPASTSAQRSTGLLSRQAAIPKGKTCADSEPSPENCALWRTG